MYKKIPIIFLSLFLYAPCLAQQPRIDSIAVDEDKGELVLHGTFQNSSSAIVLVDSVPLPVTLASDTLIRATIPVKGKGSAGKVNVIINGIQSNEKLMSYWHFETENSTRHVYSDGKDERTSENYFVHIRFDLLSANALDVLSIPVTSISKGRSTAGGSDGHPSMGQDKYTGPTYDTTYSLNNYGCCNRLLYYPKERRFYYIDVDYSIFLDNYYQVIADRIKNSGCPDICYGGSISGCCQQWFAISPTDFPPSTSSVHETPSNPNILQARLSSDPVSVNTDVVITLRGAMNVRMQIIDILGYIVFSDERMLTAGENKLPVNSSALASGIYICRLQAGTEVVSLRFVKE